MAAISDNMNKSEHNNVLEAKALCEGAVQKVKPSISVIVHSLCLKEALARANVAHNTERNLCRQTKALMMCIFFQQFQQQT